MPTKVHFLNVGQGNMTLIQTCSGKNLIYDSNITEENESDVITYLQSTLTHKQINKFICSHRDADHMRGIEKLHSNFPIQYIWDSGVPGTTTDSAEYRTYMRLRNEIGYNELKWKTRYDFGNTRLRIMNSKNDDLADNPNSQSIVIKVVHRNAAKDQDHDSVLLTGDTDAKTWKYIRKNYSDDDLSCSLLLDSHHGSLTYFDDPSDLHYYTAHLKAKKPDMTFLSVGNNAHGHPDKTALKFYDEHSNGSNKGNKLYRTDEQGHIVAILKDDGGWSVSKQYN